MKWNRRSRRVAGQTGFTLIEIMLVVVIIGMLITVAVVKLSEPRKQAFEVATREQIRNYGMALSMYELHNGFFQTTEQGLQALISPPASAPTPSNWRGPYLEQLVLRKDPWGSDYIYKNPGVRNPHGYDLYSPGPNKVEGDDDDIGNWQ